MHLRESLLAGAAGLAVVGMVAGCSSSPTTDPSTEPGGGIVQPTEPIKLKIALFQTAGTGPGLAATTEGTYEKYGLDVEPVWITSSAAAVAQLLAGDVQAAHTAYFGVIDSTVNGIPLDIISELTFAVPEVNTIETLPSSGIEDVCDFENKTVAVLDLNAAMVNLIKYGMSEGGCDSSLVNLVELPYAEVPAALERGTIDAGAAYGVGVNELKGTLQTVTAYDLGGGLLDGFAQSGLVVTKEYAEQNPDTVARIQCAIADAASIIIEDDDAYVEAVVAATGQSAEDVRAAAKPGFTDVLRTDKLRQVVDIMSASDPGRVPDDFDIDDAIVPQPTNCADYVVNG